VYEGMFSLREQEVKALERPYGPCQRELGTAQILIFAWRWRIGDSLHKCRTICRRAGAGNSGAFPCGKPINPLHLQIRQSIERWVLCACPSGRQAPGEKEYLWERGLAAPSQRRKPGALVGSIIRVTDVSGTENLRRPLRLSALEGAESRSMPQARKPADFLADKTFEGKVSGY